MTYADGNPGPGKDVSHVNKDMFHMLAKTCFTGWQRYVSHIGKNMLTDMFHMITKTCFT